jgi:hypothetical protein
MLRESSICHSNECILTLSLCLHLSLLETSGSLLAYWALRCVFLGALRPSTTFLSLEWSHYFESKVTHQSVISVRVNIIKIVLGQ